MRVKCSVLCTRSQAPDAARAPDEALAVGAEGGLMEEARHEDVRAHFACLLLVAVFGPLSQRASPLNEVALRAAALCKKMCKCAARAIELFVRMSNHYVDYWMCVQV